MGKYGKRMKIAFNFLQLLNLENYVEKLCRLYKMSSYVLIIFYKNNSFISLFIWETYYMFELNTMYLIKEVLKYEPALW